MTDPRTQLVWLRRGLATFVSLQAVTLVCVLLWGLLSSLGDAVGAKVFRAASVGFSLLSGASGISLLIGTTREVIQRTESSEPKQPD